MASEEATVLIRGYVLNYLLLYHGLYWSKGNEALEAWAASGPMRGIGSNDELFHRYVNWREERLDRSSLVPQVAGAAPGEDPV